MMTRVRHIILVLLSLAPVLAWAQGKDGFALAYEKYQQGDLSGAQTLIDDAVKDPAHAGDPGAWLLRGFIYKDVFKGAGAGAAADLMRDEALASLLTSIRLDTAGTYRSDARQAYDYLGKTFYNDAAKALNDMNTDRALAMYSKHVEAAKRMDPKVDLKDREVEFHNALGTVYTKQYNQARSNEALFDRAIAVYEHVIGVDPENYGANYNLATLYYNHGVYNIQRITPENDIPSIEEIQLASKDFFTKALPYMLKAFDMNPKRKETLLGLEGIYYSLQDAEKSARYRALYDALMKEGGEDK